MLFLLDIQLWLVSHCNYCFFNLLIIENMSQNLYRDYFNNKWILVEIR